jgi:hypothetical protein
MALKDFNLPEATPISDSVYLEFNVEVENIDNNSKSGVLKKIPNEIMR